MIRGYIQTVVLILIQGFFRKYYKGARLIKGGDYTAGSIVYVLQILDEEITPTIRKLKEVGNLVNISHQTPQPPPSLSHTYAGTFIIFGVPKGHS